MRLIGLIVQLAAATAGVFAASALTLRFNLVPRALLGGVKVAPLEGADLIELIIVVGSFHLAAGLLAVALVRRHPFAGLKRLLRECYFVLSATSLASCYMFLFSLVAFVPNFYAWLFVLVPVFYFVAGLAMVAVTGRGTAAGERGERVGILGAVWSFLFSPWIVVTGLIVLTPGFLAVLYKKVPAFSDAVNHLRVSMHIATDDAWALTEAFPGKTFDQPMYLRFDPLDANRFYVLSRPGRLYRYTVEPEWTEELLLDFADEVGSVNAELGAVGFALHPEFGIAGSDNAGYVYVLYTSFQSNPARQAFRLTRFDVRGGDPAANLSTRTVLIEQRRFANGMHNGGTVLFGPDGMLYFAVGDYQRNQAQSVEERFAGGIFRIDVDKRGGEISRPIVNHPTEGTTDGYFIPLDNPWVDREGALGEFWAIGFRNPFRMWLDDQTGLMWVGDVGWEAYEEISRVTGGDNGQWYFKEGPLDTKHQRPETVLGREVPPFYGYDQTALDRAVVGGFIYRGAVYPDLVGMYLFADNNSSVVRMIDPLNPSGGAVVLGRTEQLGQQGLTCLVYDPAGNVYATVLGGKREPTGQIMKLVRAKDAPDLGRSPGLADLSLEDMVSQKFVMLCARCHGEDGRGQPELDLAAAGMDKRPDFTSAEWQASVTDDHIRQIIERGGLAMQKSPHMPPWPGVFPGDEMGALVQYLRGLGAGTGGGASSGGGD